LNKTITCNEAHVNYEKLIFDLESYFENDFVLNLFGPCEEALIFSFEIRRTRIYDIILKDDKYFPDGIKSEFHSSFDMDPYKWIEYLRALHKIRDIEFNG